MCGRGQGSPPRDAAQLLNHEAYIHVLTAVNGRHQPDLSIPAIGHPGTTRTQEGLAVFAEFVSGTLEFDRFRRPTDRVLAVQTPSNCAGRWNQNSRATRSSTNGCGQ